MLPGAGASSGPGSHGAPHRLAVRRRRLLIGMLAVLAAIAVAAGVVAVATSGEGEQAVTVRRPDGELIARVPLDGDTFAVGYRNSIYRTLAEERYRVLPGGRFELVELAAEQVAVLEEYYAVPGAPRPAPPGDRLEFVVDPDPSRPAVFEDLRIAATDLGERTLFVPGSAPIPIWQRVVTEDPSVILDIEES